LLQAFHELKLKDAELWLIGRLSPEIIPFLQKYGGANVILKGTFPQSQLYEQYSQGSVLCLASVEEGLAMVIPQAMACGLPIVGTLNTGAEDIVRDSMDGFVVPIRNVEALKERLIFLYSNRNATRQMGETARKRILESFTWDHYGDRIVKEFARTISGANQRNCSIPEETFQPVVRPTNAFSAASS
jgi:glycosyltransferase involved in cell wall biosynthesis